MKIIENNYLILKKMWQNEWLNERMNEWVNACMSVEEVGFIWWGSYEDDINHTPHDSHVAKNTTGFS